MYNIFHSIICELSKIRFLNIGFKSLTGNVKFQRYEVLDSSYDVLDNLNEDAGSVPGKQYDTLAALMF
jgi:hypothetical protein